MTPYRPQKVFLEKDAADYPATRAILARLPDVPVEMVDDVHTLVHTLDGRPDPIGEGKRTLLLKKDKGRSFKPFPEAEQYLSCDYFTLHTAEGCDLECSYCILQAYLTNPFLTVYVNLEEMLGNLASVLEANPDKFFRIGTGQLADSLSLDPLTGFSRSLIPFFARRKNALLELKTKSTFVENLEGLDHGGNTVVSWSMNARRIQREEEHKCPPLEERLEAARRVISWGYRAGFHFDPIVDFEGGEDAYGEVFDMLFDQIEASQIAWISLGGLRFMPALKKIMRDRFPKSPLPLGEWISGMDGKMRYFKPRRIEIYKALVEKIRRRAPHVTLYLSMESPEVWNRVFGGEHTRETVCRMLDHAGRAGLQTQTV